MKYARLNGVDKLVAGVSHGCSLGEQTLLKNQSGRSFQPDLSDGWVPAQ
jgi:hypothetical protein